MKVFIQSVLYLSVGIGSLFFVTWALTSLPVLPSFAQAEEVAVPPSVEPKKEAEVEKPEAPGAPKEVAVPPSVEPKKEAGVEKPEAPPGAPKDVAPSSPPASDNKEAVPSLDKSGESVERKGASVSDPSSVPPPPPPSSGEEAVPPPPPSVNDSVGQVPEKTVESAEGVSVGEEADKGTEPTALNKLLESAKNFQKEKGASADAANDLMDINQKVVEIYKMLGSYRYDPDNRRDPFVPFLVEKDIGDMGKARPSYPTDQYDLNEIKLKGVKWGSKMGTNKALFETPDKEIHYLQKNDWIGKNQGIIYELREDEVVVMEPRSKGVLGEGEDAYVPIIVRLDRVKGIESRGMQQPIIREILKQPVKQKGLKQPSIEDRKTL